MKINLTQCDDFIHHCNRFFIPAVANAEPPFTPFKDTGDALNCLLTPLYQPVFSIVCAAMYALMTVYYLLISSVTLLFLTGGFLLKPFLKPDVYSNFFIPKTKTLQRTLPLIEETSKCFLLSTLSALFSPIISAILFLRRSYKTLQDQWNDDEFSREYSKNTR